MPKQENPEIAHLTSAQRAELAAALRARMAGEHRGAGPAGPVDADTIILGGGAAGLTLALHLRSVRPSTRIVVVNRDPYPVPEIAHKVGESTVEIAAHYLKDVLGLEAHLENEQIRKFGLRMFFSRAENDDIASRLELGSSIFPPHPTYQLDRGRLENHLVERCRAQGIEVLASATVSAVELPAPPAARAVVLQTPDGPQRRTAHWVVDATGRHRLLQRQLGLQKQVGHEANAAWFRVAHPIDIGGWSSDPRWRGALKEGRRELSTNHLMGPGYWVWLIRVGESATSVGIVADPSMHAFDSFNTLQRAQDWLRAHEPQCAAAVAEHADAILDFRVMKNYSYNCEQVFDGHARWAMTGEAAVFLDPLYSPGLDLIAIGNSLVVDMVARSLDGADVTAGAAVHDKIFRRVTDMWLAIYERQYALMGHPTVMTTKVIWDTAFYWGVFALLSFSDNFPRISEAPTVVADLEYLTALSNRMQSFFREWAALDDSDPEPQFVDLYEPLDFMVRLHRGMGDELSDDDFRRRFSSNRALFTQLAGQVVSRILAAYGDRYADDRAMAQVQAWQRDPLVGGFLRAYRRERDRTPTSPEWIIVGSGTPVLAAPQSEELHCV